MDARETTGRDGKFKSGGNVANHRRSTNFRGKFKSKHFANFPRFSCHPETTAYPHARRKSAVANDVFPVSFSLRATVQDTKFETTKKKVMMAAKRWLSPFIAARHKGFSSKNRQIAKGFGRWCGVFGVECGG